MTKEYYFAYGSNMCERRLRERVPSSKFRSVGILKGYTLRFHKRSRDGSGKCNALFTSNDDDRVFGVVFEISISDKPDLDRVEGLGRGYSEKTIQVDTQSGVIDAFTYVADNNAIDESLQPYTWYKDFVLEGAQQHQLPEDYIERLNIVEAREDPDPSREHRERESLPCD